MLHFIFPSPDKEGVVDFTGFTMHAYSTVDGWSKSASYKAADIEDEYVPALQKVVMSIVSIGAEWQASQVRCYKYDAVEAVVPEEGDTHTRATSARPAFIELRVEAANPVAKTRGILTATQYPQLNVEDTDAVAFFTHYVTCPDKKAPVVEIEVPLPDDTIIDEELPLPIPDDEIIEVDPPTTPN